MIYGAVRLRIRGRKVGIVIGADRLSDLDVAASAMGEPAPKGIRDGFLLGEDLETAIRRAHAMQDDKPGSWGPRDQLISDAAQAVEEIDPDELERYAAFLKHRAADPHCTCNDCSAYHFGRQR